MLSLPTHFIGIDVSKATLVSAFAIGDGQWKVQKFDNTDPGIDDFIQSVLHPKSTQVIVEATGNYSMKLVFALFQKGITVSVLNPKQSKGFIQGVLLSICKTDEKDACALALYGQVNRPKPYRPPSDKMLEISQLRVFLTQLKKQRSALISQLHALSFHVQPLDFVQQKLQENLQRCNQQIAETEQQLCQVCEQSFKQAYELALSVVGIGPATAQAILVATNCLINFEKAKQLSKFVGACPTKFESGSSICGRGSISKSGDPTIRALLYMGARSAKRYNEPCRLLYERLRRKGKCHKVAMVAVCNKLLKQLFAVVKNKTPFQRDYHLNLTEK